jgi:drebrin-like protein
VVRGGYQPIGKVDIAEIRRQAQQSGQGQDDRPTTVKGAYEPVGKVDIAAIRARAQPPSNFTPPPTDDAPSKSLSERSAAFQSAERLTSLPKPKVASKFSGASAFSGTRAPVPVGFTPKTNETSAPVGIASRTFADQGGKTPAQIWAEKKARQGGGVVSPTVTGGASSSPVQSQRSGEGGWKSGYTGKSWAPVQTTRTGQSASSDTRPAAEEEDHPQEEESVVGNVSSIRDRFAAAPPPINMGSRPNIGARPVPQPDEEEGFVRPSSPIRVALPVGRASQPEPEEEEEPSLPVASLSRAAANTRDAPPEPKVAEDGLARGAGIAAAEASFGAGAASADPGASKSGKRALIQYDYEKAEDNEIELKEGEYVTNIEMVDEDWWMGQNSAGESGLFPANYVEVVEEEHDDGPPAPSAAERAPPAGPPAPAGVAKKQTATAQYDYEAAEDNELSFPDGATINNVVSHGSQESHRQRMLTLI